MFTAAGTVEDEEPVKTSLNEPFLTSNVDVEAYKSVEPEGKANAMTAESTTTVKKADQAAPTAQHEAPKP